MKEGKHKIKYLKAFYVRIAFGIVELEIRPAVNSKVTVKSKSTALKAGAIIAAQHVISTYELPEKVEVIIHKIEYSSVDTLPLHIGAVTIVGIFDICENPLSEDDLQKLDRFVLLNDTKEKIDFSNLSLSKNRLELS